MVNCAKMAVDWRALTLWEYQAMRSEWNDRETDGDKRPPLDPEQADRLKRAMAANSVH